MAQSVWMGSLSYAGDLHSTSHHATHRARGKVSSGSLAGKKIFVRMIGAGQALEHRFETYWKHDLAVCTPLALPDRDDAAIEIEVPISDFHNL